VPHSGGTCALATCDLVRGHYSIGGGNGQADGVRFGVTGPSPGYSRGAGDKAKCRGRESASRERQLLACRERLIADGLVGATAARRVQTTQPPDLETQARAAQERKQEAMLAAAIAGVLERVTDKREALTPYNADSSGRSWSKVRDWLKDLHKQNLLRGSVDLEAVAAELLEARAAQRRRHYKKLAGGARPAAKAAR